MELFNTSILASVTEELTFSPNFKIFILIDLNVDVSSHMSLVAVMLDSTNLKVLL